MTDETHDGIFSDLRAREPIFHRREFGTSREDLLAMTADDFWEIGASGRIYTRDVVIARLLEFYEGPEPHDWICDDFSLRRLAEDLYQLSYVLTEPARKTRRTTLWRKNGAAWTIVFHQGTLVA